MLFSLVLATKGRTDELGEFLASLLSQDQPIEVVIIDQNEDRRLDPVIAKFDQKLEITHLHSQPGLSRARNIGLSKIRGDVVSFPDDDCEYTPGLLKKVAEFFEKNLDVDGVSGRTVDRKGVVSAGKFGSKKEPIERANIWRSHNSVSLFLRAKVAKKVGNFDEEMGLGAYFSSSEETDYVIRALKEGFKLYYDPAIEIYHPRVEQSGNLSQRGLNYGRGVGRLLRKHRDFFAVSDYVKVFLGPLLRGILSFSPKQFVFNLSLVRGRVEGYRQT